MEIKKILAIGAMISPILYTMIWVIGGFVIPGYNHISDDVSRLMAVGAPYKPLFDIMFITSSVLMILFYCILHKAINDGEGSKIAPIIFVIVNVIGLLIGLFFPLDADGQIVTWTGTMHIILVMSMGFIAMAGMLLMYFRLKGVEDWNGYDKYSLISFVVNLISGLLAAFFTGSPIMGLVERIVVTASVQYNFMLGFQVFRTSK